MLLVVVEENAARVTLLDAEGGAVLHRVDVDSLPHEVEVDVEGRTAYVSNFGLRDYDLRIGRPGRSVAVIDLVRGRHLGHLWLAGDSARAGDTVGVSRAPHGLKLRPSAARELFVNTEVGGDSMIVFDVETRRRLRSFALPAGTHNFMFSPGGDTLWLMSAASGVYRVDPTDGRVTGHLRTPTPARGLEWMPDGRLLVSGRAELLVVEPGSLHVERRIGGLGVGQILYTAVTPDGRYALAPAPRDSVVAVVDLASGRVVHRLRTGLAPIRVVVGPGGRRAYVANAEDTHVSVIELRDFTLTRLDAVRGPNGLAILRQ